VNRSIIAFVLFVLVFSSNSYAVSVDIAPTIVVKQAQKDLPLTILNDQDLEEDFSVSVSAPFGTVVSPNSGRIGAGKSTVLTLSILPDESLAGSTYEATLEIELGNEKAFKRISVLFKEEETGNEAGEDPVEGEGETPVGMFSFAEFSGALIGILTFENALNAVLVLIAAILLIAFIARFVKRLEAEK